MDEVAIVVDPNYGVRLRELASVRPVWIADTSVNRAVAEELSRERKEGLGSTDVTVFRVNPKATPEDWCYGVLEAVDLHHGGLSSSTPYRAIRVIGCEPTERLRAALTNFGLNRIHRYEDGFLAERQ